MYIDKKGVPRWVRITINVFAAPFLLSAVLTVFTAFGMLLFFFPVVMLIDAIREHGFIIVLPIIALYIPTGILAVFCWIADGDVIMPMIDEMIFSAYVQISIAFCIAAAIGLSPLG